MANQLSPKQLSSEIIRLEIENLYDLSSLEVPIQMTGGVENAAWHFKTNKGDLVIKVYAPHMVPFEKVVEETALYEYLNKHGINVPKVLSSKRAQPVEKLKTGMYTYPVIAMKFENLRFTRPASIQKDELVKIAQIVTRMHKCLKQYPRYVNFMAKRETTGKGISTISPNGSVLTSLVKIARRVARMYQSLKHYPHYENFMIKGEPVGYDTLVASPNASVFTPEELTRIRVLDQKMQAYLSAYSLSPHLTKSIIHGDLALGHAPFLTNGDVYLFDFADRSWGPIAEELAGMLVHLYLEDEITFDRWEKLRDWTLAGYTSATRLTSEDLNTIFPFMMRRILLGITYLCNISRRMHREVDSRGIKRKYQLADYLLRTNESWKGNHFGSVYPGAFSLSES